MDLAVLLFAVCVLSSWETRGSSDVTTVFVQKGKDLHLDVKKPVVLVESTEFRWKFNDTLNVVRLFPDNQIRIPLSHVGRAEVSLQNHSLLLKNVQQNDSGDYIALISGYKDQPLTEYKVIIQDPVSSVQLSVNSVSNSTDSCNLTVTCSTEHFHIRSTFRCDTQTCNQEGGEKPEVTTSGSSLQVYLLDDYIACNHSNQVSQTEDRKEIKHFCPLNAVPNWSLTIGSWIGIIVGCLVFILCIFKGIKYRQKRKKNCENTIYEVLQNMNPAQTPNQNAPEDATDLSPNSMYAMVEFPTRPTGSTETKNITLPETIYSQLSSPTTTQN